MSKYFYKYRKQHNTFGEQQEASLLMALSVNMWFDALWEKIPSLWPWGSYSLEHLKDVNKKSIAYNFENVFPALDSNSDD